MAVSSMAATIGWGPQGAKEAAATSWYRHKAVSCGLGVFDETRLGNPEIGGRPVPTFPFKSGVTVGGDVTLQPRLESTLGWLLYAMLGDVSSAQVGGGAAYDHTFKFLASDPGFARWLSFRKHLPRKENVADTDLGEIYQDCKIVGATLALPSSDPITLRMDVLGRNFTLDHDPSAWSWANTYEDYQSIPVGSEVGGYIEIPDGTELPVVAANVVFANQPLDLRQERVYGDPFIEDVTVVQRMLTFDILVKWNNPDLYAQVLTGSDVGTTWSSSPFVSSLDVKAVATGLIPTTAHKYALNIAAPSVMLALNGPITLAGNQAVVMRFTGNALDNVGEYVTFVLRNAVTSYAWPAADTTPPTVSSASVEDAADTRILVNFGENVQLESGSWMAGFSCTVAGGARAIVNGGQVDANTIYLDLASAVTNGQAVLLSYSAAVGNIADLAGNDLADFTDTAVTNNVA